MLESALQKRIRNKQLRDGLLKMATVKAVIFDFIGTLADVENYDLEFSKMKLHEAIRQTGFNIDAKSFLKAYTEAHEKYRLLRYRKLVEVTNAAWISEALNNLGFKTKQEDARIKSAVNVFFEDYLGSLKLRPSVKRMLNWACNEYKLGLISNFTCAPVIYAGVKRLGIDKFFNAVVVSDAVGWRKPHAKIFETALKKLDVHAGETVCVGDCPREDIRGAKAVGMKTVFVPSQFYSYENLVESREKPDFVVESTGELCKKLPVFIQELRC